MEEQILQLDCKKHIKIFKLHQKGMKNKMISELLKTSPGHVGNVLKEYKENPDKVEAANSVHIQEHQSNAE